MKPNLPKVYIDFIEQCKIKEYGELFTHKHHILPKFMGGNNDDDNLIVLSIEDHFLAHKILAEHCDNDEYIAGNKMAAAYIAGRYKTYNLTKLEVANLIREAKKEYYKNNEVWNKGKKGLQFHTEESKLKISKSLKNRVWTDEMRNKISEAGKLRFKNMTEEDRQKYSESLSGKNNPFYGKKHSKETIEKIKQKRKNRNIDFKGNKNPAARKCIDLDTGIIYGCIKEMANVLNIPRTTMQRWLKNEKIKKYSYYE